jgi:hypothetical protein
MPLQMAKIRDSSGSFVLGFGILFGCARLGLRVLTVVLGFIMGSGLTEGFGPAKGLALRGFWLKGALGWFNGLTLWAAPAAAGESKLETIKV